MPANYVLINEYTTNASVASVTLSNIPTTGYTDLKLVVSGRLSVNDVNVKLYFNADSTASNYANRRMFGDGGGGTSSDASTASLIAFATNPDNSTASTFGSAEIYFPNYSVAGLKKTYWTDNVTENNANTAYATFSTMLWQGTAAISSITMLPNTSGNFVAGCTFAVYGIAALGTTPTVVPSASGGDIIVNDGTFWYHAFLASGVFIPNKELSCNALVVAGGGGGGWNLGGGGGAGGLVYATQTIPAVPQSITVGAGGNAGILGGAEATAGGNSTVGSLITAAGGGRGGSSSSTESIRLGGVGGSAGGSDGYAPATGTTTLTPAVNPSPPGQGNAGGGAYGNNLAPFGNGNAGGGGGAGAVGGTGSNGSPWQGGNGGNGLAYNAFGSATSTGQLSGGSYYYAGGGGGASLSTGTQPIGGLGGGGLGGRDANEFPTAGTVNTGGGGGGSRGNNGNGTNGGSGIVIIRYAMA
jgi:hypothetical protein